MTPMTNRLATLLIAASAIATLGATSAAAAEAAHDEEIARQQWSFGGFKGQYNKEQLQRGFLVYQNVCATCHSLSRVNFRNLVQPGGPEFAEEAVKALAAAWPNQISQLNEAGESAVATKDKDGKPNGFTYVKRPALLSDPILGPDANEKAARAAHGGALPPDLSLIAKARGVHRDPSWWTHPFLMLGDIFHSYQEGGADYVYALLTHYADVPAYKRDDKGKLSAVHDAKAEDKSKLEECVTVEAGKTDGKDVCNKLPDGLNYNTVFAGHQLAMPSPLSDNVLTDKDGYVLPPTLDNYARDVAAFLAWTADPTLDQRKRIGWQVMLYLLVTTGLLWLGKRRIWTKIKH
jgi:ubiquinol-cytochrome c reductase cytochrome c1 subunit